MLDSWRDGARIDMAKEMMGLTLDVVGRTLFSTDLRSQASEIGQPSGVGQSGDGTLEQRGRAVRRAQP